MAQIMDEIVVPWRTSLLKRQGPIEDEAVKLGFLIRGWIREFMRDSHFARFAMRNGAFIHKADSISNREAMAYYQSGADKGLFVLSPVESKYLSLGVLTASAALILRESADKSLAERTAHRLLVMLGVKESKAHEIATRPMAEFESLDFIFQRRLEEMNAKL